MPSSAYNEAVGAIQRRTSAKIIYDIVDVTANKDAALASTDSLYNVSRINDLVNSQEPISEGNRWTSLENGYFSLDGKSRIIPNTTEIVDYDVGYWSDSISDLNGEFDTPLVITVTFTVPHSSIGFSLVFDNEYAIKFDILFLDANDEVIREENITNNDNYFYELDDMIDNYSKVVLTFYKTKNVRRRLRLYEIIFGLRQTFTDEEIISLNITRELNIIDEVLPASELTFVLDNLDKRFNFLNREGIYQYIQIKQLVRSFIGVYVNDGDIEYMNTGQYFLDEWETDGITASFTARDNLYFVPDNLDYTVSSTTTKTLTAWLEVLFLQAGINDYIIDSSLDNISVATRFDATSIKSLIKSVCTAGNCIVYVGIDNVVRVSKILSNVIGGIKLDNMYSYPKVKLDTEYNTVKVGVYSTSSKKVTSYVSVDNIVNNVAPSTYEVMDNPFIVNNAIATNVGNYYLNLLKRRELYDIEWRQNPALDISDIVEVEDNFDMNGNVILTKQEYSYTGYLGGHTEGRGIYVANS